MRFTEDIIDLHLYKKYIGDYVEYVIKYRIIAENNGSLRRWDYLLDLQNDIEIYLRGVFD